MTPSIYSSSLSSILSSTFDRRGSLATNTTGRTSISEYPKYISGGNYVDQGTFDLTNMGAAILPVAPARIHTGSFGRVHLVRSKHNLRFYAIKVLHKEMIVRMKQVEHTNNEARILDLVRCPFIINIWGTFQDTASLYMVMDFVPGGELLTLLRRSGRFPDPVAKFYAAEVVLALSYMHGQQIVYRDLKPENILLNHDGHITIADFGFAKQCKITWTLCGTPDYFAPEIHPSLTQRHPGGPVREVPRLALGSVPGLAEFLPLLCLQPPSSLPATIQSTVLAQRALTANALALVHIRRRTILSHNRITLDHLVGRARAVDGQRRREGLCRILLLTHPWANTVSSSQIIDCCSSTAIWTNAVGE